MRNHPANEVFMRNEVIWPKPHTYFQIEYPPSSMASIYGLSAPGVWLLPCYLLCIFHHAVLVLCWSHFRLGAVWIREAACVKPGRAHSHDACSLGRVSRDLGCCKKCILFFPLGCGSKNRALKLMLGKFDSVLSLYCFLAVIISGS